LLFLYKGITFLRKESHALGEERGGLRGRRRRGCDKQWILRRCNFIFHEGMA
jgi:hypothetical protein